MITPKRTSKGLIVEFKSVYTEDGIDPKTYEGVLIALHKQKGKGIVLATTDHISDDEVRTELEKAIQRLKDKCPNEANITILAGYFYHIVTRDENELPLVHKRVEHVPEGYEFVIPIEVKIS